MSLISEELRHVQLWLKSEIDKLGEEEGLLLTRWQANKLWVMLGEIAVDMEAAEEVYDRAQIDPTLAETLHLPSVLRQS